MTVVGSLAIDRAKQIELFDDLGGLETENFPDRALQFSSSTLPVQKVSTLTLTGSG